MSSKNNPQARNKATALREYKGQPVSPTRVIDPTNKTNIIGAVFENGDIVVDANNRAIPYKQI